MLLEDPESLDVLRQSPQIESLWLRHFRRIHSLEPLKALTNLRELDLRTIASWDASSRHLMVDSFEPLTALTKLEKIFAIGVLPRQGRLEPLSRIPSLSSVSINSNSSFYQLEDFAALSAALPKARASLRPVHPFLNCLRCKKHRTLRLKGAQPRHRRSACPLCDRAGLVSHLERWNRAGGMPKYEHLDSISADELETLFAENGQQDRHNA